MKEPIRLPEPLDLSGLSEEQQLAFFGALFAVAAADDQINEAESSQILDSLDLNVLSEESRERALALSIAPPSLQSCLDHFADADHEIQMGLMLNLVDVALADDEIEPGEPMTLEQARIALGVAPETLEAMHEYSYRVRLRHRRNQEVIHRPMACPPHLM